MEKEYLIAEGRGFVAKLDSEENRETIFIPLGYGFGEEMVGEDLFNKIDYNEKVCNVDKVCSLFLEYCLENEIPNYFEMNYYYFIMYVMYKYGLEDYKSELISKEYTDKIIQSVKIKNF